MTSPTELTPWFEAVKRVATVWVEPAAPPMYHEENRMRIRKEWPALGRALDILSIAVMSEE